MGNISFKTNNTSINKFDLNGIRNINRFNSRNINDSDIYQEVDYSDNWDKVESFCDEYGIPSKYYGSIRKLYEEMSNGIFLESKLIDWIEDNIKNWKDDPNKSVSEVINCILNKNNIGLKFKFTDEFLDEHIEWLFDNFIDLGTEDGELVFNYILFNNLDSDNTREKLYTISGLLKKIKDCNIPYEELEKQIPNFSDYLFDKINIDGMVKDKSKLADFWNSIAFYTPEKDEIWDRIFHPENIEKEKYGDTGSALVDLFPNSVRKVKDFLFDYGIYVNDHQAKRLTRLFIRKMLSEKSKSYINCLVFTFEDIEDTINDPDFSDLEKLHEIKDTIYSFEEKFNIDLKDYGIDIDEAARVMVFERLYKVKKDFNEEYDLFSESVGETIGWYGKKIEDVYNSTKGFITKSVDTIWNWF